MPPTQARLALDAICALGNPDEILREELCAPGEGTPYMGGRVRTERYKTLVELCYKFFAVVEFENLFRLMHGRPENEVGSYEDGEDLGVVLEVRIFQL